MRSRNPSSSLDGRILRPRPLIYTRVCVSMCVCVQYIYIYIYCLNIRHVTQNREGDNAGKKASARVDEASDDGVLDAFKVIG